MKRIVAILLMTLLYCSPAFGQEVNNLETDSTAQESINTNETKTMYAKGEFDIYSSPDEESEVLGTSLKNTSFETVNSLNEWTTITTEAGFAYIKSEHLQDNPLFEYTEEELYTMAHVICGEAQSCSDEEQLYIGSVVLNRVVHPAFPNTIEGVVFQKGQYACIKDGNYYREPTERNWANAKWLLENGSVLPSNVIWQSGGRQGKGVYVKTKWHYYCY